MIKPFVKYNLLIIALFFLSIKSEEVEILITSYNLFEDKSEPLKRTVFNTETAEFSQPQVIANITSSFYIEENNDMVYVTSVPGKLHVLKEEENNNGTYEQVQEIDTQGYWPCYISVKDDDYQMYVSNYGGETVLAAPLNSNGTLNTNKQQVISQVQTVPSTHQRQTKSHPHSIEQIPGTQIFLVPDLGTDSLFVYKFNEDNGKLELKEEIKTAQYSGPRHMAINKEGTIIYLVGELDHTVIIFSFDKSTEKVQLQNTVSTLPDTVQKTSTSTSSHIELNENGYLYVGNRGIDTITVFKVLDNYQLEMKQSLKYGGIWPWHIQFTPDNKFLIVTDQGSNSVRALRVLQDGQLEVIENENSKIETYSPVHILVRGQNKNNNNQSQSLIFSLTSLVTLSLLFIM